MKLIQFQVDAFATHVFEGNPAAIVPLETWLDDSLMQAIAAENNYAETAFFVPEGEGYHLRWFTPAMEVDLCGHATLASAYVLFEHLGHDGDSVAFRTRSGMLTVGREPGTGRFSMDFPATPPAPCALPSALVRGLGVNPSAVLAADDYLAVFEDEAQIRSLVPDLGALAELDLRGVCVTAPGVTTDFVSRFFAPKVGIPEDSVTGSAHCMLAPYWADRLGKTRLEARQISKRGGRVGCEMKEGRVLLRGAAALFLVGELSVGSVGNLHAL